MAQLSDSDVGRFQAFFPGLVDDVMDAVKRLSVPEDAINRLKHMLGEVVPKGRLRRSLLVLSTGRSLLNRSLTEEEFRDLSILGWLHEFKFASDNVSDDIMDGSTTRRGEPCWHLRDHIGMAAVNHSILIRSAIFILLKKHFSYHPAYYDLVESFHDAMWKFDISQECDSVASTQEDPYRWAEDEAATTAVLKVSTLLSSVVVSALHYCQMATALNLDSVENIVEPLGKLYMYQNDLLDIVGDPKMTGKVGTDIKENKRTWVIIRALQLCSDEDRRFLKENYGKCRENADEVKVEAILRSLPLTDLFGKEEDGLMEQFRQRLSALDESEGLRKEIFQVMGNGIYRHQNEVEHYSSYSSNVGWATAGVNQLPQ